MTLGIRPEHVMLAGTENADATLQVELIEKLGSESYLYGTLENGTPITVRSGSKARRNATSGWASASSGAASTSSTRPQGHPSLIPAAPCPSTP